MSIKSDDYGSDLPSITSAREADPTVLTTRQILREIALLEKVTEAKVESVEQKFETRLSAMDKAIILLQAFADRQPTTSEVALEVASFTKIWEGRFSGIEKLLLERDKRWDVMADNQKSSISTALTTQKEFAETQNTAILMTIAKMEVSIIKMIDQGNALLMEMRRANDVQISDIKSRLDKGEGRTVATSDVTKDGRDVISMVVAIVAVVIALGVALLKP